MITNPMNNIKDFVREYIRDINLMRCINTPLREDLKEFIKEDDLGEFLRSKSLQRLSGTLPKNDGNLRVWEKTLLDEFWYLGRWISNYAIGYCVAKGISSEKAIEAVNAQLIAAGFPEDKIKGYVTIDEEELRATVAEQAVTEIAEKMLQMGLSIDQISQATGIKSEEIERLK